MTETKYNPPIVFQLIVYLFKLWLVVKKYIIYSFFGIIWEMITFDIQIFSLNKTND